MKAFSIFNSGLHMTVEQEVKEKLSSIKCPTIENEENIISFETENLIQLLTIFYHIQSVKRLCLYLSKSETIEKLNLPNNLIDFFTSESSFKVEVENVKGNDNRIDISKKIASKVYSELKKNNINPSLDLKKPKLLLIVYFTGKNYYLGIDLKGKELNQRYYRLFTSANSFKGDYAYHFVRQSLFKPQEKLLVGFIKDGTILIEAGLFSNSFLVQSNKYIGYSFSKFPSFLKIKEKFDSFLNSSQKENNKIYAFDENIRNITASKKNAILAGCKNVLEISKCSIEDLDVRYSEQFFDRSIFQIGTKDEANLNELYYQVDYVLKPKGTLLLITREKFELPIPSKFKLLKEEIIVRGESKDKFYLLQKK